jgi:energy-coupling factor transport system permease protein
MKTGFMSVHPFVAFLYYILMLIFTMLFLHPFFLLILFITTGIYTIMIKGKKAVGSMALFMPIALFIIIINPLFNHRGTHILFYIFNKPITEEALIYGIIMALMLLTIVTLYISYEKIIDSHKFLYLFSKLLPRASFVLAMTLRYIPLLKRRTGEIREVQRSVGANPLKSGKRNKIEDGMQVVSILTTWSLEDALLTAESMTAKGYGLKKRTSYCPYKMRRRDIGLLCVEIIVGFIILISKFLGYGDFAIYPTLEPMVINLYTLTLLILIMIFASLPIMIDTKEVLTWHYMKSKI